VRLSYYDALREGRAGTLCRLASAACTRAHELATYLTSRATYYVGYRPVQYRLARDLHMRHVQTQDGGGTKKKIPVSKIVHVLYSVSAVGSRINRKRNPRPRSDLTFSAGGTGRGEHLVFRMKYDTSMRFGFLFRIRGGAHTRPVHARLPAVARTCVRQEVRPCGCAPLCAYVRPLKPKPPGTLWHLVAPCGTLWHPVVPMWYRPSFSMQTDTKPRSTGESWFSTF